jgi:putative transposase
MQAAEELSMWVGTSDACGALGLARSTYYRHMQRSGSDQPPSSRARSSPRALSTEQRQEVLGELHCLRFVDQAPRQVYARLLDEGNYLCSIRTMYRILEQENEVRERRNQLRHPEYKKPELLATGPNQVWSWDITKLLGPVKWTYFYLYVILDIFSRYVVGWMVAERENASLAKRLIEESCCKQEIVPGQLMLHSDRGSPMKAQSLAMFLGTLGVTKSYSRPHVSDDNPFSESQFKTLKYRPDFPKRFGSIQDALQFCRRFFDWYNRQHYHSALALLTPEDVHYGRAEQIIAERQRVLTRFYEAHPERFVNGPPKHPVLASEVWINPSESKTMSENALGGTFPASDDQEGLPAFNICSNPSTVDVSHLVSLEVDLQGGNYTKFQEVVSQNH